MKFYMIGVVNEFICIAFGALYVIKPTVYKDYGWMRRNAFMQKILFGKWYEKYMRKVGVFFILLGCVILLGCLILYLILRK